MGPSLRTVLAAVVGLFAVGLDAQIQAGGDLNSVLSSQKNLTTFYSLIQKYPKILSNLPSSSTILAPDNAAFIRSDQFTKEDPDFITSVLQYHILQDKVLTGSLELGAPVFTGSLLPSWTNLTGGLRVELVKQLGNVVSVVGGQGSRSTLLQGDILFNGGAVQVIDALLVPPGNITVTTNEYNFTSFQGALYAAKVLDTDFSTTNVTIFTPNNDAFQALGSAITSMTSDDLAKIMNYHTLNEVVYSPSFGNGTQFTTKEGGNLTISRTDNNGIFINSAALLAPDIMIANGVLHVIDNVLNPGMSGNFNKTAATQVPVFSSASKVTNLPFTSAIPTPTTTKAAPPPTGTTSTPSGSATVKTSSSKALAAAMARETGFAAGLMAALGGAALLI